MTSVLAEEQSQRGASIIPDAEFPLTASDFKKLAALIHGEAGIVINEGKANLVYSRLVKRLRAVGLRSFRQYCELVQSSAGAEERVAMIAAMTTNVTRFFREGHHFDHLRTLLEPMVSSARAGKKIRIWSSACSSGEEPYSIAMTLLDVMPNAADHDVLILATDIDPNMVARGMEGRYRAANVTDVPRALRDRWMETEGRGSDTVTMSQQVRSLIRFKELNLLSKWPMEGKFDIIFCRNVMIYFDEPTQDTIWTKFAKILNPRGTLFIGHSERIALEKHPFDLVAQTTYRLKGSYT